MAKSTFFRKINIIFWMVTITLIFSLFIAPKDIKPVNKETLAIKPLTKPSLSPQLKVHFIDVGQGDSIFIDYGDYDILIDAGNNDEYNTVVNYLKQLKTDDIEIMVATHPHADHIGELDDVLKALKVEKIIDSGTKISTKTYQDYLKASKNELGAIYKEDADMVFDMGGGAHFRVIEAGDNYKDTNENSVVTLLDYKDVEFLFTGDLQSSVESKILNRGIAADVLKVGHHGSKTSSSEALLSRVKPKVAIISAGLNNKYGHPDFEALKRISKYTKNIFGTWTSGTIIVTTDGKGYSLNTDKKIVVR